MDYDIVADDLELTDPNPDIWALFRQFDSQFFEGTLTRNCVELSWSPRMTLTAGLCAWSPTTSFCSIKISAPLLRLRPRRDLIETLLHEMIHGFLFVTHQDDNHESHGDLFHFHMFRINEMTGTRISVYHTFHGEVDSYRVHIWKCNGPCQYRHPFYGLVKRSMNRKPGPHDNWWAQHQASCSGEFIKIAGPDPKERKTSSKGKPSQNNTNTSQVASHSQPSSSRPSNQPSILDYWSKLGPGQKLGSK